MADRIVVIGGSAGSLAPLKRLVGDLLPDLPAAVFVTIHIPPWSRSELAKILASSGPLPAQPGVHGEHISAGHIYVAPPDHHLMIEDSRMSLWRGPKENLQRPAINVLFRSAAVARKENVIGAILSGTLEDGAAGLYWIKKYGGVAVVQDPASAEFPDMPRAALHTVDADYIVEPAEIGSLLARLASQPVGSGKNSLGSEGERQVLR